MKFLPILIILFALSACATAPTHIDPPILDCSQTPKPTADDGGLGGTGIATKLDCPS